jgi:hypothetical protein
MSNSLILYVGGQGAGHEAGQMLAAAAEARQDYVYQPESLMQALGMYITYFPQVVVIDMALEYAQDVYMHLCSVDARPIFLLTDEPRSVGERERSATTFALPRSISAEALLDAIEHYTEPTRRVPNGTLRYA